MDSVSPNQADQAAPSAGSGTEASPASADGTQQDRPSQEADLSTEISFLGHGPIEPDPEKQSDRLDHGVPQDQQPTAPNQTDAHDTIRSSQPLLPDPGVPGVPEAASVPGKRHGSLRDRIRLPRPEPTASPEVQKPDASDTNTNVPADGQRGSAANDATKAKAAKPKAKSPGPSLVDLSNLPIPLLPNIDIVAIHDLGQSLTTAWTYTPEKDFAKHQEAPSTQGHAPEIPRAHGAVHPVPTDSSQPFPHGAPTAFQAELRAPDRDIRRWSVGVALSEVFAQGRNVAAPDQDAALPPAGADVLRAPGKAPTTLPVEPGISSTDKGKGRADPTPRDIGTVEEGRRANQPAHQKREPPSTAGRIQETGLDDDDRTPTRISRQSERPSSNRGSKPPSTKDKATKPVNWLTDRTMLAGDLAQARVLAFSYKPLEPTQSRPPNDSPPKVLRYDMYLKETAEVLLSRLKAERPDDLSKIPLVLIATGFGCLIVQKLIGLIAESQGDSAILDMVAAIVFFDAPDTNVTRGRRTEAAKASMPVMLPSPANSSRTMRVKEILQAKLINAGKLWEPFHATIQHRELSTVWFYTPAQAPSNRAAHAAPPRATGIDFVPLDTIPTLPPTSSTSNRPMPSFKGSRDPNYCRLVEQIKRCLVLKASANKALEEHLTQFIASGYKLDVKDHRRRCPLHRAAECLNDGALTRLVTADRELAGTQDEHGLTPLHVVVIKAVSIGPKEEDRAPFRIMVEKLLLALTKTRREDDTRDEDGKTPWDYAADEKHRWIRELRDLELPLDGAKKAPPLTLESLVRRPEEVEAKACSRAGATLAQFYIATDNSMDYMDPQRPDVYTLIYHPDYGIDKMFQRNLRHDHALRATCRWIHLPANNEQWAQDLFVQRLRRIDKSTSHRRHQGSAPFDRQISPGAFKCEQIFEPRDDERNPHSAPASPIPSPALSDRSDAVPGTVVKTGIALFMPVFGFETHGNRQKLTSAMKNPSCAGEDETSRLIRAYFDNDSFPLHCRRTLDQFTYHMLSDTESRDMTQVMYKWTKRQQYENLKPSSKYRRDEPPSLTRQKRAELRNSCPLLMVDQLWLWCLEDEETVITCLPNTWESTEDYNLVRYMIQHKLRDNDDRWLIENPLDLVNLIVQCSVDFLHRPGPLGVRVFECFQSNIAYISAAQAIQFGNFKHIVKELNMTGIDQATRSELTDALFRLTTETQLLAEIMDIQDELKTIHEVLQKQKDVLREFLQLLPDPPRKGGTQSPRRRSPRAFHQDRAPFESLGPQAETSPFGPALANDGRGSIARRTVHFDVVKDDERSWHQMSRSKRQAKGNLDLVSSNIATIKQMLEHAGKVQVEINALLSHRQKQANAWEARFAREGSEHTQRQSNITLVFTMVTVFFLPLSFMSSIFAIQIDAYPHNTESGEINWPLGEAMGLLFGISIAVILLIALIGFNINRISNFYTARLGPGSETLSRPPRYSYNPYYHEEAPDSDEFIVRPATRTDSGRSSRSAKSTRPDDEASGHISESSESLYATTSLSDRYALLLGRWRFHSRIPMVRRLWEYRWYFSTSNDACDASRTAGEDGDEDEGEEGWQMERIETIDWDYPLHRARMMAGTYVRDYILQPLARLGLPQVLPRTRGLKEKADSDVVVVVEETLEPELFQSAHAAYGDMDSREERYTSPGVRRAASSGSVVVVDSGDNTGTILTDSILRRRGPQRTRARGISMSHAAGLLLPWRWRAAAGRDSRTRRNRDHNRDLSPATMSTTASSSSEGSMSRRSSLGGTGVDLDVEVSSGSGRGNRDADVDVDEAAGSGRKGPGRLWTALSFLGRRKVKVEDEEIGERS